MTVVTTHQLWPQLRDALHLPEDMAVMDFKLYLSPVKLPQITMTLAISPDAAEAISNVIRHYELKEKS